MDINFAALRKSGKEHYMYVQHMAQRNTTIQILAETNPQLPVRAEGNWNLHYMVSICREAGAEVAYVVDMQQ